MGMLILAIPMAINALATVSWRGWYRWAAVVLLFLSAGAYAIDAYSLSQGGNLSGLFTMITAPVVLIVLLLFGVGNGFAQASRRRGQERAAPRTAGDDVAA